MWAKMISSLATIGYDSNNMHLAAYDWRLSLQNLQKRDKFYSKLKANLEMSLQTTGLKAVLVSHRYNILS